MMSYYLTPYRRFRRIWNPALRTRENSYIPSSSRFESDVHIPMDVWVEDESFVIRALVPGLTSEDLNIQAVGDTITIRGELTASTPENGLLLHEIPSGQFQRTLRLPDDLDMAKAEAIIEDGVLTLRVPKTEAARPKTIKILAK